MHEHDSLANQFDAHRDHLRAVAFRLLGSAAEADDAIQEVWFRVTRADTADVENLRGWLTTVVSRVCLDMLRARDSRREESLESLEVTPNISDPRDDPEQEALMADSIGTALLVVLDKLAPVERTVFVLHDVFGLSFEEIARIVDRTPPAARQIAVRARRRVRGPSSDSPDRAEAARHHALVEAFVAALRVGDLDALLRVLDPDFVFRADAAVSGTAMETRGAVAWATQAMAGARAMARGLASVHPILLNGAPGLAFAPHGHLKRVVMFTFGDDRIVAADLVADPARLATIELSAPQS